MITQGIVSIIKNEKEYRIVEILDNGIDAKKYILNEQPDIAILDIEMGKVTGLDVAQSIKKRGLKTKIIILTMHKDKSIMLDALDLGVQGYITKDQIQNDILECLETVAKGNIYVEPDIFDDSKINLHMSKIMLIRNEFNKLIKTEKNVIRLINKGFSTKEVASRLFVAPKTIEHHRANICRKLEISGHNSLVRWVNENHNFIQTVAEA